MGKNSLKPGQQGLDTSPVHCLADDLREGYMTPLHFLICEMEDSNGT